MERVQVVVMELLNLCTVYRRLSYFLCDRSVHNGFDLFQFGLVRSLLQSRFVRIVLQQNNQKLHQQSATNTNTPIAFFRTRTALSFSRSTQDSVNPTKRDSGMSPFSQSVLSVRSDAARTNALMSCVWLCSSVITCVAPFKSIALSSFSFGAELSVSLASSRAISAIDCLRTRIDARFATTLAYCVPLFFSTLGPLSSFRPLAFSTRRPRDWTMASRRVCDSPSKSESRSGKLRSTAKGTCSEQIVYAFQSKKQ